MEVMFTQKHTNSAVWSMSSWWPLELRALYMTSFSLKASGSTTTAFEAAPDQNDLPKPIDTHKYIIFTHSYYFVKLLALENDNSARVELLLFKNVFKNSAFSSSHASSHKQKHWTPLTVDIVDHVVRSLWVKLYCFHLFHQCREHSCHLQILRYSLKPLFPVQVY